MTRLHINRLLSHIEYDLNEMRSWEVDGPQAWEYVRPLASLIWSPGTDVMRVTEAELEMDLTPCPRHVVTCTRLAPRAL